jgi:hypothetical protein
VARIWAAIRVDVAARSGVGPTLQALNKKTAMLMNIHCRKFCTFMAHLLRKIAIG